MIDDRKKEREKKVLFVVNLECLIKQTLLKIQSKHPFLEVVLYILLVYKYTNNYVLISNFE